MLTHLGHDVEPVKKHWFVCYGTNCLVLYCYCIWLIFVFSHVFPSGLPSLRLGLLEDCLWWSLWAWVLPYQWGGRASRRREPWDASWRLRLDTVHLLFLFFVFYNFSVQVWIQKTDRNILKYVLSENSMGPENPKELESKSETKQETREAILTHDTVCLLRWFLERKYPPARVRSFPD